MSNKARFEAAKKQVSGIHLRINPKEMDEYFKPAYTKLESRADLIEATDFHLSIHVAYALTLPLAQQPYAQEHIEGIKRFHDTLLGRNQIIFTSASSSGLRGFPLDIVHEVFDLVVSNLGNGQHIPDQVSKPLDEAMRDSHPLQRAILQLSVASQARAAAPTPSPAGNKRNPPKGAAASGGPAKKAKANTGKASKPAATPQQAPASTKNPKTPSSPQKISAASAVRATLNPGQIKRAEAIRDELKNSSDPKFYKCCRNFHSFGSAACLGPQSCNRPHACPLCPGGTQHSIYDANDSDFPEHAAKAFPPN
jgi:hypothetical protein